MLRRRELFKLLSGFIAQREVAGDVLGVRMTTDTEEWGTYAWSQFLLNVPSHRIAGGTDEIMRNVIGERLLGLPREPRPMA